MAAARTAEGSSGGTAPPRALFAWLAFLVVVVVGAVALGRTPALATPPLTAPGDLAAWASGREPVEAAFAAVRVAVAIAAAYLLAVTVLGIVLRTVRAGRLLRVVDVVTVPVVRRLVQGALGLGMAGATVVAPSGTGPAMAAAKGEPVASLEVPAAGAAVLEAADAPVGPPTMERLDEPAPAAAPAPPTEVVLVSGDHLWSTAERALATAWGRAPSDAEVTPFWDRLVAANRERLPDPANPDLVLPGQRVVVPPVPPLP